MLSGMYGDVGDPYWYGTAQEDESTSLLHIHTQSEVAKDLFMQGLMLMYGFNRVEARRNFKTATVLDPKCVLCWWGLASVYTHTMNEPTITQEEYRLGKSAIKKAKDILREEEGVEFSEAEKGFVDSLGQYYGMGWDIGNMTDEEWTEEGKGLRLENYINRLREVCTSMRMHPTCATLLAENLMRVTPWNYYTVPSRSNHEMDFRSLKPNAKEAKELLIGVFEQNINHSLALHLWIHLMEPTNQPEEAEHQADLLAQWPQGVGHLVHMSGHIYHRLGRYEDSIKVGLDSMKSDALIESKCLVPYTPLHNAALMQTSALMIGRSTLALEHAEDVADFPLHYSETLTAIHVLPRELIHCRFGMWAEILSGSKQRAPEVFSSAFTTAISEYARGLAYAAKGQRSNAELILVQLQNTTSNISPGVFPKGHSFYGNYEEMGEIMKLVLEARLDMDFSVRDAIGKLAKASEIQHQMTYIEPEPWYMPVKQCLGALLLHAGDYQAAINVFREDLDEHPSNGFSIVGMINALSKKLEGQPQSSSGNYEAWDQLGRDLASLISDYKDLFQRRWAKSDKVISGSCCELGFC